MVIAVIILVNNLRKQEINIVEFFKKKRTTAERIAAMPEMPPEEPAVNYNSVLDYLVSLSDREFKKMNDVAVIYREANTKAAKILGVKNEPTNCIKEELQTSDNADEALDGALDVQLQAAFLETSTPLKGKKEVNSDEKQN